MDVHCIAAYSQKKTTILRWLNALILLSSIQEHTLTYTHIPPPVLVEEGYYLMESCFFLLLSAFPQTPCLPCQENNESTKPFVRTSTKHFHLRCPPIPKKMPPTLYSHFPSFYLNVVSLPSPLLLFHLPILLLAARTSKAVFFSSSCFSTAVKMCSRFAYHKMWLVVGVWSGRMRLEVG